MTASTQPAPLTSVPTREVVLADGRIVLLRPLVPTDAEALEEAYQRLSPPARAARFGSPPLTLRGDALAYLSSPDGVDHVAFVAEVAEPDQPDGRRLLGVGRIMRYPDDPGTLDIGLTVADDARGVGLGRVLAEAVALHRPRPARRILTAVSRDNKAALRLLALFGEPVRRHDDLVQVDLG